MDFKGVSTHLNEQISPSHLVQKVYNMGDFHVISTTHAVCGFHACQCDFQLFVEQKGILFQKFLVMLESLDGYSLFIAVAPPS